MNIGAIETDALTELFNIGLHRAAASLSDLTRERVIVDLPRLWVCPISELRSRLGTVVDGELATVHQIFRGPVGGDAVLVLEYDKAALLANLMTDGEVAHGGLIDQSAREVLTEVGNIVLSACLSAFGNILDMTVTFSVPRIHIESLEAMLRSFSVESKEVRYAMIAATRFRLSQNEVSGYLIVIIGLTSLIKVASALTEKLDPEKPNG
jgi:chemotaxis protein CheC